MIINIFGVGRSGTKSLQLFIAYCLLHKHKTIRLNYEPYFWASRLLKAKSFKGIQHHLTTKHFTNSISDFSTSHQTYLKSLCEGDVVINKFIRANGRIQPIAEITKANYNILLVRNLEQVLRSIKQEQFDFHSIGSKYPIDYYEAFIKDAQQVGAFDDLKQKIDIKNIQNKNAVVWFAQNIVALRHKNIIVMDYSKLSSLEYLQQKLSPIGIIDKRLYKAYSSLSGKKIHKQEILLNKQVPSKNKIVNQLLFYSLFRWNKKSPFLEEITGDIVELQSNIQYETYKTKKKQLESSSSNSDIQFMNELVMQQL